MFTFFPFCQVLECMQIFFSYSVPLYSVPVRGVFTQEKKDPPGKQYILFQICPRAHSQNSDFSTSVSSFFIIFFNGKSVIVLI